MKTTTILAVAGLVGLVFLGGAAAESGTPGTGAHPTGEKGANTAAWLQEWARNNPKRYDELMKLKRDNPEGFRKQMGEIYLKEHGGKTAAPTPNITPALTKPAGTETAPHAVPPPHPYEPATQASETTAAGASKTGEKGWTKPRDTAVVKPTPTTAPPTSDTPNAGARPDPLAQVGGTGTGSATSERSRVAERFLKKLHEENPERYEKLKDLRDQNPTAFNEEVHRLVAQKHEDFVDRNFGAAPDAKVADLAKQFRTSTNPVEREQLKAQLRTQLGQTFDSHLNRQDQHLQDLEQQLNELRQQIATRKAQRDVILQQHLDGLLEATPATAPAASTLPATGAK